jgi:hypothetical protein
LLKYESVPFTYDITNYFPNKSLYLLNKSIPI